MIPLGRTTYLQTGLPVDAAIEGLRRATVAGPLFSLDVPRRGSPPLRGRIDGASFSVVRRTQFRNSFTPVAEGRIVPAEAGSQVQVRLGLHLVPILAVVAWFLGTVLFGGLALQLDGFERFLGVLLGLPLVGPAVAMLAFRHEREAVIEELTLAVTSTSPR